MNALRKFGVHITKRGKDYHVYGLVVGGLREYNGTINYKKRLEEKGRLRDNYAKSKSRYKYKERI